MVMILPVHRSSQTAADISTLPPRLWAVGGGRTVFRSISGAMHCGPGAQPRLSRPRGGHRAAGTQQLRNGVAHALHDLLKVMQVVPGQQHPRDHLAGAETMVQIGAAVFGTGRAAAGDARTRQAPDLGRSRRTQQCEDGESES